MDFRKKKKHSNITCYTIQLMHYSILLNSAWVGLYNKCGNMHGATLKIQISVSWKSSSGGRVVPCGQMDGRMNRYDEANSKFCKRV